MTMGVAQLESDLTRLGAVEQRDLVRARKVSPVELLDAHLAAIARLNPVLNAIVTLCTEEARKAARQAEDAVMRGGDLGILHGLPVVIKDITETAGIRTTYGSPLYADHVPDRDAEVVARLRRAGAIILGKSNTPEFAAGASTVNAVFGATRNPWNPALSPAGSSGGSAAAVASGMVPLAQGTDFGCSVRIPAAFCGIVGLRTTPGLIPNDPMPLPWDPGQVHGPLARRAEDAALMLDAMVGLDPLWPISVAPTWRSALDDVRGGNGIAGLRIAYVSDIAGIGVDPEVERVCRAAVHRLGADGARVDEIAFSAAEGREAYMTLRADWMVGQQFERLHLLDRMGKNLAGNVRDGLEVGSRDMAAAQQVRAGLLRKFRQLFGDYDFLITPAAPVEPFPVEQGFPDSIGGVKLSNYVDWIAPAYLVTLMSLVGCSVPAGLSRSGLPVGLQIIGPRFSEPRVLGLARHVQQVLPIGWPREDVRR
jgi:amidase